MRSTLFAIAKVSTLVVFAAATGACSTEASPPAEGALESEQNAARGTPAARVRALRTLTPITKPTNGILPPGEPERRFAKSGGRFTQGLWSGKDDDGRACTVHVIHYDWRDGGASAFLQAWYDDDAQLRRYNEDFDPSVSGVEAHIARTSKGPHILSLTDDPDPGDDVRKFEARGDTLAITVNQLVKNTKEDRRDVSTEIANLGKPGGRVVVRIEKFGFDDIVRCGSLAPKKGPTDP